MIITRTSFLEKTDFGVLYWRWRWCYTNAIA